MMTMYRALHPRDSVDRLYLPRKEGDRGLISIEDCVDIAELSLKEYRKHTKYNDLIRQREHLFSEVKYINLSVSALGVFDQLSQSFLDMQKVLNCNPSTRNFIIRKITIIAILTTYYIFCRRDKDWDSPSLLICKFFFFF